MKRTRVKFCGLVRPGDVDAAVALGVDAIGLVFYPRSPRYLTADAARELRRRVPSYVSAVGLFVNTPTAEVAHIATRVGLDVLQFHGDESPADCEAALPLAAPAKAWWRAVRMRGPADLLESTTRYGSAEAFLLDKLSEGFGGSGETFDWNWLSDLPEAVRRRRLIMAGGLTAVSVGAAIDQVRPFGVDVSSGIQGADPRQKDLASMERFMQAVLTADARNSQGLAE